MFKPHILTKLIEKSNLYEIRNLLLVGGEVSKNLGEILNNAYLFPKIELENDGNGLKYRVLGEKVRLQDYHQLIARELATAAYKMKLNPEDILECGVVEEAKVTELFTNVDKKAQYFRIKLKKDIVSFLILLMGHLRAKEEFKTPVNSEICFWFLGWYRLENVKRETFWFKSFGWYRLDNIKRETFWIYWGVWWYA